MTQKCWINYFTPAGPDLTFRNPGKKKKKLLNCAHGS